MATLRLFGIRTLPELLQNGGARYLNWLFENGTYGQKAWDKLKFRFPDALSRSIDALINHVKDARAEARRKPNASTERPERQSIPRDSSCPQAYCYDIEVSWDDPRLGKQVRTFRTSSPRNISYNEIANLAEAEARTRYAMPEGETPDGKYGFIMFDTYVSVRIVAIYRRT